MELKEMIKVMQHYDNGGDIEYSEDNFKTILGESNKEDSDGDLCWDWYNFKYRIKEQKQKVTIEKWLLQDKKTKEYYTLESDNIELSLKDLVPNEKIKLLDTYEVEL